MDFKGEYKNLQKDIKPSAEFLERLEYKMNVEKEAQRLKKNKHKRALILAPILATVGACAAAVSIFINIPRQSNPEPAPVHAADVRFPYATGVFGNKESLSDSDALPRELSQMLSQDGAALYKSSSNTFDYDDLVSDSERAALAKKIKSARKCDEKAADGGEFYMLTLENGDIFKFGISEDILVFENNFYRLS